MNGSQEKGSNKTIMWVAMEDEHTEGLMDGQKRKGERGGRIDKSICWRKKKDGSLDRTKRGMM